MKTSVNKIEGWAANSISVPFICTFICNFCRHLLATVVKYKQLLIK